ncbi:hypothetical protein [Ktedonospora formicarum]|uniref:Uncharacterized protein n=1 Tax=Ktedonospora formicarum TaxID=2778364 RepID=A0A8J3HYQ0_9CHLR|nr:hypothetical protein [Ktedonospora formicarum]GHO44416.1 hypothetical protein KSX_25790 [Ktedonospora formicarum]
MPDLWDKEHELEDRFVEIADLNDESQGRDHKAENSNHSQTRRLWLGSKLTRQQKRRRLLWTIGTICLTLIIFLASLPSVRVLITDSLSGENKPAPGAHNLYFVQVLPGWGTLTIDGKTYTPLPTLFNDHPIQLTAGKHDVKWLGEPFQELQCTLIVASSNQATTSQQTCRTSTANNDQYQATMIIFPQAANLERLPGHEQKALRSAVQSFLTKMRTGETVQPGERYKLDYDAKETFTARQELQATRSFQLDTDTHQSGQCQGPTVGPGCMLEMQDCRLFCSVGVGNDHGVSSPRRWDTFVVVREHWEFQSTSNPEIRQQSKLSEQFLLLLRITREQGQWHIAFQPQGYSGFNNPSCTLTMGTIFGDDIYRKIANKQQSISWQFVSSGTAGCVGAGHFTGNGANASDQQELQTSDVYLLTRFNVLLVGNDKAHALWPKLPQTSKHTYQIIEEILQHPQTIS